MKEFLNNIRELTEIESPSGREGAVAKVIRKNWQQYGEICEDGLGNLSITIGRGEPHIAFVAHMDEVGFVIRKIGDDGFISLNKLGGIPERVLAGQKLLVIGRKGLVSGVFTTWPHHLTPESEKYKVRPIGECWLDVGARNSQEVERLGLRVGDFGVYARSWHIEGDTISQTPLITEQVWHPLHKCFNVLLGRLTAGYPQLPASRKSSASVLLYRLSVS